MKQVFISVGCNGLGNVADSRNSSLLTRLRFACASPIDLLNELPTNIPTNITGLNAERAADDNYGAVMYIVAVLVFYSLCIIIMIIKYLRRGKKELEDEKVLEDFFRSMSQYIKERERSEVNNFAIHAFHALTSVTNSGVITEEFSYPNYTKECSESDGEELNDDENDDDLAGESDTHSEHRKDSHKHETAYDDGYHCVTNMNVTNFGIRSEFENKGPFSRIKNCFEQQLVNRDERDGEENNAYAGSLLAAAYEEYDETEI